MGSNQRTYRFGWQKKSNFGSERSPAKAGAQVPYSGDDTAPSMVRRTWTPAFAGEREGYPSADAVLHPSRGIVIDRRPDRSVRVTMMSRLSI